MTYPNEHSESNTGQESPLGIWFLPTGVLS